ncbi:MAG: hypothetical protein NTW17_03510 [Candidatus Pacearchaeota archaeon]|nr:hypothetical protein [Candidatus Pacearchaeota archaeon]
MDASEIYILIMIVSLLLIAILFFVVKRKNPEKLTPLASISFAFVLGGILFGDERLIGYSLMGIGIILAIADIYKRSKKKK